MVPQWMGSRLDTSFLCLFPLFFSLLLVVEVKIGIGIEETYFIYAFSKRDDSVKNGIGLIMQYKYICHNQIITPVLGLDVTFI